MDPNIKNPYSYTFNFGFARDLGHNFSIEAAYVGRLSHRLLTQSELMMPLNLKDTKSGIDYFTAAQALVKLYNKGVPSSAVNNQTLGPTAAYWQNMVQALQQGGAYSLYCSGGTAADVSQAVYDLYTCFQGNDTTSLSVLDTAGHSGRQQFERQLWPDRGTLQLLQPPVLVAVCLAQHRQRQLQRAGGHLQEELRKGTAVRVQLHLLEVD